jgi:hypothetical protein
MSGASSLLVIIEIQSDYNYMKSTLFIGETISVIS